MSDHWVSALCASQDGLASRSQALHHLSSKQVKDRLAAGRLVAVRHGVYRAAGAPPARGESLRAALLAAGPGALASHRSAGELWGLPGVMADVPEILAPWPQWPRLPGVSTHQSRRIPAAHRAERHGMPVTSAARTLVDLAGVLPRQGVLGTLVDHALHARLTTLGEIRAAADLLSGRGRRGLRALRAVLDDRAAGPQRHDSPAERRLAEALAAAGLPPPIPQHQVVCGPTVYLLDLAYPDLKLGIEYDAWHTHGSRAAFDRDRTRGNRLAAAGWTLLHVTSGMPDGQVVAAVAAAHRRLTRAKGTSEGQMRGVNGRGGR